jgi:hypothetical protein
MQWSLGGIHIENKHAYYQSIAWTKSFRMGLASAEGQKLENLVDPLCTKAMIPRMSSVYTTIPMNGTVSLKVNNGNGKTDKLTI